MDRLLRKHGFLAPELTDEDGVVAIGGSMEPDRLLAAYRRGIFPWSGNPVRWHSPDPRAIFWRVRIPAKLGKMMRRGRFVVTFDEAFGDVIRGCAESHRDDGVWITREFITAYTDLHRAGYAHSVEVWQDDRLVGGLYGVQLRGLFAGESMFYRVSNASKVGFAYLIWQLQAIGTRLLDCQVLTEHTLRLGAVLVRRADYLRLLGQAMRVPTRYDGQRWPRHGAPEVSAQASKLAAQANGGGPVGGEQGR